MIARLRRCLLAFVAALCVSISFLVSATPVNAAQPHDPAKFSSLQRARLAIQGLQSWYDKHTGLYRTTGWWNSANAITTLADYSRAADTNRFNSVFRNTFKAAQKTAPGFINQYYDDEGWWALAWVDVYDQTGREPYLDMAESIFANMTTGWSNTCAGGIWWSKKQKYKNAIANELFLSLAAHLANRAATPQRRSAYLAWATREWQWFSHSGMINANHLVNDGLDDRCRNNGQTTWTYNQGVILGGLAELYRADHDPSLLAEARNIASAALSDPVLVDQHGILHEPCEPKCGGDGTQFKGIFIRNLSRLDQVAPAPEFQKFILANAQSIWAGARPPRYHLGPIWYAPYGTANASTQSSAADALVAAYELRPSINPAASSARPHE
ncbi:MAG TPA: glycoside hydrolase family 76 protein [Acidobacteriaceae bacterium]|nr:glycoside hydrolase family 76 protein [Acidobacteriaceae bacterium]